MNAAVSGGHPLTIRTARDILSEGGNAVDAAVAAFMTSWVVEPCMSSAGGGGFAQVYSNGETTLYDFFCQTPALKIPAAQQDFFPVDVDFGETTEVFHIGKGSGAVPGSIAGAFALHRHYGTIPMPELAQPAIQVAKEGHALHEVQTYMHHLLKPILQIDPVGRKTFFRDDHLIDTGELIRFPEMADFLEYLAREGEDVFYKGEVAKKIARDYEKGGGHIRRSDLENYKVILRKPKSVDYKDHIILTNPLPSLGGEVISKLFHSLAKKKEPIPHTISRKYVEMMYDLLHELQLPRDQNTDREPLLGSTTHLNIIDKDGNAVSLTASNGEGSGYFAENTQIQLNNMLGEAALLPKGFHSWERGERLSSLMSPTMVFDTKRIPQIVIGSSGAGRIPFVISQVIHRLLDHGISIDEALDMPRLHLEPGIFHLEPGFEEGFRPAHHDLKRWEEKSIFFGGIHALQRKGKSWVAAGDPRRKGVSWVE